jgi:hypothetical protein
MPPVYTCHSGEKARAQRALHVEPFVHYAPKAESTFLLFTIHRYYDRCRGMNVIELNVLRETAGILDEENTKALPDRFIRNGV